MQQLKTRRYQRMQDHLSDCRRALEQCDGERASCSQQADACTTRLAAFDAALADTAGAGHCGLRVFVGAFGVDVEEAAGLAGPAPPKGTPRTGPERGIAARRFGAWSA